MGLPSPTQAIVALATFVRDRFADGPAVPQTSVTAAAAPFAPNPYARTRLMRQLHATGLLVETAQSGHDSGNHDDGNSGSHDDRNSGNRRPAQPRPGNGVPRPR